MKKEMFWISLLMVIMMVGMASASLTFVNPSSSEHVAHTIAVNVTAGEHAAGMTLQNITNCTLTITSGTTANTTQTVYLYNDSISMNNASANLNTATFEDGADYQFAGTCMNGTAATAAGISITTVTGVVIDNHEPPAASALSPADAVLDKDGTVTFSATVTDANTTGCTILFAAPGIAHASMAMSYATSTCTLTTKMPQSKAQGYEWTVRVTDGTNTTDGSYNSLTVQSQSNIGAKALVLQQQAANNSGNGSTLVWLVLGGLGLYVLVQKKIIKFK